MFHKTIDGFQFFDRFSELELLIEEERIDEYVNYINLKNIKHIVIRLSKYKKREIGFISKCPNIEKLELITPLIEDYTPIYSLKHLKLLNLDESIAKIN